MKYFTYAFLAAANEELPVAGRPEFQLVCDPSHGKTRRVNKNQPVAGRWMRSCDASSQKVCATPSSREYENRSCSLPSGSGDGASLAQSGDGASPVLSATEASQLRPPCSNDGSNHLPTPNSQLLSQKMVTGRWAGTIFIEYGLCPKSPPPGSRLLFFDKRKFR